MCRGSYGNGEAARLGWKAHHSSADPDLWSCQRAFLLGWGPYKDSLAYLNLSSNKTTIR